MFGNWEFERVGDISGPIIAISFFVPTMLLLMGDANMYQRIFSAQDGGSARKAVFFWIIGVVILESVISMLSCAKIGACHAVIFDGLSKEAISRRINLFKPDIIIAVVVHGIR